eukprot:5121778-Pyramimonas_sp.AAC.1
MVMRFLRDNGVYSPPVDPELPLIPEISGAVDLGRAGLHHICAQLATGAPGEPSLRTWVGDIAQCISRHEQACVSQLPQAGLKLVRRLEGAHLSMASKPSLI